MKVTTAYMFSPEVATAYVMASVDARQALGLTDCSTGPEVRIFDHLWRGKDMLDSLPGTQGFEGEWGLEGFRKANLANCCKRNEAHRVVQCGQVCQCTLPLVRVWI